MVATVAEIVDVQQLSGQEVLNVFHFVDESGVADVPTLVETYVSDVIPLLVGQQSTALSHTAIRYRAIYPAATIMLERVITPVIAGTVTSDALASCDAASFKFVLSEPTVHLSGGFTGHIKRGGCRVAGLCEEQVVGNTIDATHAGYFRTWSDELLLPGTGPFQLCVVSFLIGDPVPHVPRDRAHTATSYTIVGSISDPSPSTQNSRKVLRGRTR